MKVRMKFAKTGPLMYVGHLDLLRYFQKVFRRAGVDIAYSQGFSPHQITSFAAPLGLGITSEGEYLDAEFNSITTSKDMLERINAATLTPYIKVTEFVVLREGAKKAMASVAGADYYVTVPDKPELKDSLAAHLESFLAQKEIRILKKTKKSEVEVDIRPHIHCFNLKEDGFYLRLTTGSNNNLKPELVMSSLCSFSGVPYEAFDFHVHRLDMLLWVEEGENVGHFAPLSSEGDIVS